MTASHILLGAGKPLVVELADPSYYKSAIDTTSPYDAIAGFRINSDGNFEERAGPTGTSGYSPLELWLESGAAADVDCRIVHGTGVAPTGMTSGTWYNCGTTQEFYIQRTSEGLTSSAGTLYFRDAATLAALDSATYTLDAECGLL